MEDLARTLEHLRDSDYQAFSRQAREIWITIKNESNRNLKNCLNDIEKQRKAAEMFVNASFTALAIIVGKETVLNALNQDSELGKSIANRIKGNSNPGDVSLVDLQKDLQKLLQDDDLHTTPDRIRRLGQLLEGTRSQLNAFSNAFVKLAGAMKSSAEGM